jgi:hypothetical protein
VVLWGVFPARPKGATSRRVERFSSSSFIFILTLIYSLRPYGRETAEQGEQSTVLEIIQCVCVQCIYAQTVTLRFPQYYKERTVTVRAGKGENTDSTFAGKQVLEVSDSRATTAARVIKRLSPHV